MKTLRPLDRLKRYLKKKNTLQKTFEPVNDNIRIIYPTGEWRRKRNSRELQKTFGDIVEKGRLTNLDTEKPQYYEEYSFGNAEDGVGRHSEKTYVEAIWIGSNLMILTTIGGVAEK